jgi:hypothetical protein
VPKRVQISSNIDPFLKKRLERFAYNTDRTFRKALEHVLRLGLDQAERVEELKLKGLEKELGIAREDED